MSAIEQADAAGRDRADPSARLSAWVDLPTPALARGHRDDGGQRPGISACFDIGDGRALRRAMRGDRFARRENVNAHGDAAQGAGGGEPGLAPRPFSAIHRRSDAGKGARTAAFGLRTAPAFPRARASVASTLMEKNTLAVGDRDRRQHVGIGQGARHGARPTRLRESRNLLLCNAHSRIS